MLAFNLQNPPIIGNTNRGNPIHLGGFSGLYYLGQDPKSGEHKFVTHTDRGPNGETLKIAGKPQWSRPMKMPDFVPEWIFLKLNLNTKKLEITERIKLKDSKGNFLRGVSPYEPKIIGTDEWLVDQLGKEIPANINGIDPEGITKDDDGNFWMCEEYFPSLLKFSSTGTLLKRYVPNSSHTVEGSSEVVESLPKELRNKRINLGFEGITFFKGKIYAALQSPLKAADNFFIILEFDPKSEKFMRELKYPMSKPSVDKIGDLLANESGLFVLEENSETGPGAIRHVFQVKDLSTVDLHKELYLDVSKSILSQALKVEGMTLMPNKKIAFINDNDFDNTNSFIGILDLN